VSSQQHRVPRGTPRGGEFARSSGTASPVTLDDSSPDTAPRVVAVRDELGGWILRDSEGQPLGYVSNPTPHHHWLTLHGGLRYVGSELTAGACGSWRVRGRRQAIDVVSALVRDRDRPNAAGTGSEIDTPPDTL
jgi:hypothetical protein